MYFVPTSIFLGKVDTADCWLLIFHQVIWIFFLYVLMRLMWNAAIKKLVIQGG
jgi:ABC-2 type transport system permease protein